jgi:hypothetical protein
MSMFDAIVAAFSKANDPFEQGYQQGIKDAQASLVCELPYLLRKSVDWLSEEQRARRWDCATDLSNDPHDMKLYINFRVEVTRGISRAIKVPAVCEWKEII